MAATMRIPVRRRVQQVQSVRKQVTIDQEATVACPYCKDIQTVLIHGGELVRTRKFSQVDGSIYHDCGSLEPCRILSKVLTLLPDRGN